MLPYGFAEPRLFLAIYKQFSLRRDSLRRRLNDEFLVRIHTLRLVLVYLVRVLRVGMQASFLSGERGLLVLNSMMEGGDDAYCQEEEGDMRLSWYLAHADLSKVSFK
jgi:hypothetical protein